MEDWNAVARLVGFSDEKVMLDYFYNKENLPISEIAKKLKCGQATIAGRLEKHRIGKRPRGGANNKHRLALVLLRMDQRQVFLTPDLQLAKQLNAHPSTIYKYKRSVTGGHKTWNSVSSVPSLDSKSLLDFRDDTLSLLNSVTTTSISGGTPPESKPETLSSSTTEPTKE